ncbi:unnamed protein product [Closterium sp. NIES-64]|nr:unnamed protein product [Closterium sp. NIES-64]
MAEVDVAGLSAGTTHTGVTGGGSVPTARRYSLGIVQPGGAGGDAGGAKVLSSKSELKDALTAFQQTFVMCDATKPDNPIMFAISKAEVAEVAELRAGRGQGKAVAEWWWGELVRTALDVCLPPLFPDIFALVPLPSASCFSLASLSPSASRFPEGAETDKADAKLRWQWRRGRAGAGECRDASPPPPLFPPPPPPLPYPTQLPHSILPRYPPLFPPTAPLSLPCPFPSARSHSRFLQGEETDKAEIAKLRAAVAAGESWCGRLLNYKKDGSPFWNLLTVSPVKDDNGTVVKFIGMQVEVTKYTEGAKDKETRPNALPVSLIKYDARQREEAESTVSELVAEVGNKSLQAEGGEAEGGTQPPKAEGEGSGGAAVGADGKGSERRKSGLMSLLSKKERSEPAMEAVEEEDEGEHKARRGLDLATTLERIQKNFVITDPRLPENPIIFASDDFLELTEYSREEILGRNCRFLQGPDTDPKTVQRIRDAIKKEEDITVQLLNYTKSGKQFWNLFHLQAVRDNKGMLQYFIGVQLDASQYVDPSIHGLQEKLATEGEKIVLEAANNVEGAVRELADPGAAAGDLWAVHTAPVAMKPHKTGDPAWQAIQEVIKKDGKLSLKHFRPIKPLGAGDTGSVHLVELRDTNRLFAMKAMDKEVMVNRNKVHRACTERDILGRIDFPFLPTLYASFQTATHVCLITEFCAGGELYGILEKQKGKRLPEAAARFFVAEVLLALEYLHCHGVVYRDLKPENVLVQESGHAMLTDFDLSFSTECKPKLEFPPVPPDFEKRKKKAAQVGCGGATKGPSPSELELELLPILVAEPEATSNSFVGTEEYIAPEIISGTGHSSPVDWWTFGIFLYELLYGRSPFRGRNRQRTFTNVLTKDLAFPANPPVSDEAKDLMRKLLQRDPADRLGAKHGAIEIRAHPFFKSIEWPLIRNMKPPQLDVPVKAISAEAEEGRPSTAEEEMDWDENEARPSTSLDYGY